MSKIADTNKACTLSAGETPASPVVQHNSVAYFSMYKIKIHNFAVLCIVMDFLLLYSLGLLVADAPLVGVEVVQAVAYVLREAEGDILVGQQEHTHWCVPKSMALR